MLTERNQGNAKEIVEKAALISVIVPVYHCADYIEEAVTSITNQTYRNIEIILVDDGSTDGSGQLCDALAERDARIRVLHKPNGGVSSARNLGIASARGEFIGFVDGDDFCEPTLYEQLHAALIESDADISLCMFNVYAAENKTKQNEPLRAGFYTKEQIKEEIILPMLGTPASAPQCAPVMGTLCRCLFKTVLIKTPTMITMQPVKMAEDLLFDIAYLCRCQSAVVIGDALYNYRQNMSSATHSYITDLYSNISTQMRLMKEVLVREGLFDAKAEEYYSMTVLYNITWCISNESKSSNRASIRQIIQKMREYRNLPEYTGVLKRSVIRNIRKPEQFYFWMIKLRLYRLIIWFNRRKL